VPYPFNGDDGTTVVQNFYKSPPGSIDVPPYMAGGSTTLLPPPSGNQAIVAVVLPNSTAEVWFDGQKTNMTGYTRVFNTPDLTPGRTYHYTVKAVWNEGDRRVEQERTVSVTAGKASVVDFTKPAK
jgi:uncharacterized protein (TIGR03000 family)